MRRRSTARCAAAPLRESVLERLNLPPNFGYALLLLALALLLAPYLRGSDFGVIKIPELAPGLRRWLMVLGPLLMAGAVLIHVRLPPPENAPDTPSTSAGQPVDSSGFAVGDRVLTTWQGACLFPATVQRWDGGARRVRFDFGTERDIAPSDPVSRADQHEPEAAINDAVYVRLKQPQAWAPATVTEIRGDRVLVTLAPDSGCTDALDRGFLWARRSELMKPALEVGQ